jgi:uncharacterized protein YgiM (DUF1202 family)
MTKWWMVALCPLFAAAAVAQEPVRGGEVKTSFEKRSYPFEGEISADRLNVRMFPKADGQGIIASVLTLGEKVTVVGEKDDFYQILPPKGATVWVIGRHVRRDGAGGVVSANDVPVRLDSRVNADAVAVLKEGDPVSIVGENMGWYKIQAPAAVKYFVGKKYVRAGAAVEVVRPAPEAKKPGAPAVKEDGDAAARATLAVAEQLLDEQRKLVEERKGEQVDFSRVVAAFESARDQAKTEAVRLEAERGLKRYRDLHVVWESAREQILAKEAEVQRKLAELNRAKPEEAKGPVMVGHMDTTGLLWKRPGTHKLVMGGKIVCFLRVKEGDEAMITRFNDVYGKYVGVNGTVIKNPDGWDGYSVVVVDELVPMQGR